MVILLMLTLCVAKILMLTLMMTLLLKHDFDAHAGCSKEAKARLKFSCQETQAGFRDQISPDGNSFMNSYLPKILTMIGLNFG